MEKGKKVSMPENTTLEERSKKADAFCKTFIDDGGREAFLTQDEDWLGVHIAEDKLIRLNESLVDSEIAEKSNAYYVKRVDNHLEIGYARVEFFR